MKKMKANHEIPKYKLVIPIILSVYMVGMLFANGMEQKTILLVATVVGMILWYIGERIFPDYRYLEHKRQFDKRLLALICIFLGMSILSEIFSKDYSNSALQGDAESLIIIFCYVILFYMTYECVRIKYNQMILQWGIIICATFLVGMSVLEFLDIPIATLWLENPKTLELRNRVVLTFGNSNYYGIFCCMLFPFVFESWLHCKEKRKRYFMALLSSALVCCAFMSKSTTTIYLLLATIALLGLYEYKILCRQWKWLIDFVGGVILIGICMNMVSSGKLYELTKIGISNEDAFIEENKDLYKIKEICLEGNQLIIKGTDHILITEYDEALTFYDGEKNVLGIKYNNNKIFFTESPYNLISVGVSYDKNVEGLLVEFDAGYKDTIVFFIVDGCFKGVSAEGTAIDDISGNVYDEKWSSLFTGRGYIWLNTLPLLKEVVLVGKGFGNFVYNVKQYDYVGLLESQGTHKLIIDRPHNMFLQYCVDIGIIGTVALFVLIATVLFGWVKIRILEGRNENVLFIASFFAIIEFVIFMFLNDSLIVLSPYMWIFLGINLSLQDSREERLILPSKN